jgi:hypothetical protein
MERYFADRSLVSNWYDADTLTASPSQFNFLIFVPLFSFLSLAYLEITPRFVAKGKASIPQGEHILNID